MKQMRLFAAAFVALVAAGTASIPTAQAADLSYSADIGAVSKYVWRGWAQSSGAAVQGDLNAAYGGLTGSIWISNSYTNTSPAPNKYAGLTVVETDWTLDYSGSYGKVGYDVGGLYYTYLNDSGSNFPEIYAGLSYDAVISPSVKVSYTPADSNSKYYKAGDLWVDLGLSGSVMGVDLSGTLSYANWKNKTTGPVAYQRAPDQWKDGFNLISLSMSKDFKVGDATMTPSLNGTIPIAKKDLNGNRDIYGVAVVPEVWIGMNFSL